MKRFAILILVFCVFGFSSNYIKRTRVYVGPESQLVIKGKTNINRFSCEFDATNLKNPIPVYFQNENGKMVFEETHLVLNTRCFDCGNKHMNQDFYDLLKADVYPEVVLNLRSVSLDTNTSDTVNATVDINISGVMNSYKIPLKIDQKDKMIVTGTLELNINDFNIEAPRKALGLIVVSEFIKIDLNLNITEG